MAIRSPEVRLILADGSQAGVVGRDDALSAAREAELDLVEISPNVIPPVCKVMNYGKFVYQASKQKSQARKKHKEIVVKEIKFRPATGEADYQVKLRKIIKFLQEGKKVKATIRFLGRELAHRELGDNMMKRLTEAIVEVGIVESMPRLQGRQMTMVIAPKRTK